jgi:HEAT repeat protein
MGTNGIAFLVEALDRRDNTLDRFYRHLYPKLPAAVRLRFDEPVSADTLANAASLALINVRDATPEQTVPRLVQLLAAANPRTRLYAAGVLGDYAMRDPQYPHLQFVCLIPKMLGALNDSNEWVRINLADALGRVGPAAKDVLPALEKQLKDDSMAVRIHAAKAMFEIDTNTVRLAIPVLKEAVAHGDPQQRHWAAVYFSHIVPDSEEMIPVFVASLTNDVRGVRISAAYSLSRYGPEAKAAVPSLLSLLNDSDAEERRGARRALEKINPEAAAKAGGAHGQDH